MLSTTETEEERCMDSLPQIPERNYRPHTYETRLHCCKRVRESRWPIRKVAQYYHVKKPSLYRWLKRYDQRGEGALRDLPHRPKSPHPASIPKGTAYKIKCLFNKSKSNGMSSVEIWVKANAQTGLSMCYMTVLRQLKRLDGYAPYKTNPKRHCKKYHTPDNPGDKWQMDVKFVPSECKSPKLPGDKSYYQYTILDEATRKRFLYYSDEHSMFESVRVLDAAVAFFGYGPSVLQTDNGTEFTDRAFAKPGSKHGKNAPCLLDSYCESHGIAHKLIRPRTPEHNGKVERSHRIDQEKFYRTLLFHSLKDLREQGARWARRYNEMPRMTLKLRSPNQAELELLRALMDTTGEVRCPKLLKRLTSFVS